MDGTKPFVFADHTTLRVGGPARFCRVVETHDDFSEASLFIQQSGMRWMVLGGGSNVLPSDDSFDGCVVRMKMRGIELVSETDSMVLVNVAGGEMWDEFVAYTVSKGWWGVENLSGIPGTVGATPIQNVGAYGVEVGSVIESVETRAIETGEKKSFSNQECMFGYRGSFFKTNEGKKHVVTSVLFRLTKNSAPKVDYKDLANVFSSQTPTLSEIRNAVLLIRKEKFPDLGAVGTAGSFFKNPILTEERYKELQSMFPNIPSYPMKDNQRKIPLAWILDKVLHLNGYSLGNVGLFEHQPLVLVAKKGATAKEIDAFARSIEAMVFEKTGIVCEREVQTLV
ncbi:MAG: UDP-N-acetylmuramate dehydrogenase [Candidatus Pacebacteria bacterium]|nr:UDP-N-acetylmuramate dehydrogenase [Candidatus Paceibacterota bacterium]